MKLLAALVLCLAVTGCGEVVVFGHVVRENPSKAEAAAQPPATEAAAPAAATSDLAAAQTAPAAASSSTVPEPAAREPAVASAAATPAATSTGPESATATPATGLGSTHATAAISTAAEPQSAANAARSSGHLLRAVNVTLSAESVASGSGVDTAALLDAIRAELRSRKLLDEQSTSGDGTAEVLIEGATTHRTVNAVVFGIQPMAGTLEGELHVSSARGEHPAVKIVAESRFSLAADGENKNALGPLYRRFAVLTADEIAGMAAN